MRPRARDARDPRSPAPWHAPGVGQSKQQIGSYLVEEQLGRGGMGAVYRARHAQLGHAVALKLILELDERDPEALARFQLEGQALARLRHEHLVAVLDGGRDPRGRPWLAMELVEGEDLDARLAREGPLSPPAAAALVADLAEALAHAHARGVLHRDVKPSNVLLRAQDGKALLTDFGLAKRLDRSRGLTQTGEVLGSPGFLAPEQCGSGQPNGPATDVYGLGALLYALLVGRPPCRGQSLIHTLQLVLEVAPSFPAGLPPGLVRICARCLAKAPAERYPSASELAAELRACRAELDRASSPRSPRPRLLLLGALAVGLALLAGSWLGLRGAPEQPPLGAQASGSSQPRSSAPPAAGQPTSAGQPAASQPSASQPSASQPAAGPPSSAGQAASPGQPGAASTPAAPPASSAREECLLAWSRGEEGALSRALARLPLPERAPLLLQLSADEGALSEPQLRAARRLDAPPLLDPPGRAALALLRATCALEELRRHGTDRDTLSSVELVLAALELPLPLERDLQLRVLFAQRFPLIQRLPKPITDRLEEAALRRSRAAPRPAALAGLGLSFSLAQDRAAAPFLAHALSDPWAGQLPPRIRVTLASRCALSLLGVGRYEQAIAAAQVAQQASKEVALSFLIATCHESRGELAASREVLEGCGSAPLTQLRLGWVLLQLGELDALERLVAGGPGGDWRHAALRACLELERGSEDTGPLRRLLSAQARGVPIARVTLAERLRDEPAACREQLRRALLQRCGPRLIRRIGAVYAALGESAEGQVVEALIAQSPPWLPEALRTCEEVYAPAFVARSAQLELALRCASRETCGPAQAEAWFRYGLAALRREPLHPDLRLRASNLILGWRLQLGTETAPLLPDTPRPEPALRQALAHLARSGPLRDRKDAALRTRIAANANARADQLAPIEAQLGEWLEANPQEGAFLLERALLRARIGLHDELTRRCFQRAGQLAEGSAPALHARVEWGVYRVKEGDEREREEARTDLEELLELPRLVPTIRRHILIALVESARPEQARADEARLLSAFAPTSDEQRARLALLLAKAARRRGEPRRALELLSRALRGRPHAQLSLPLLGEHCQILLDCERPAEALEVAEALLAREALAGARLLRCRALRRLGRRAEAQAEFARLPAAEELLPGDLEFYEAEREALAEAPGPRR